MAMLVKRQGSFLPGLLIASLIMSTTPLLNGCSRNRDEPEASAATSPSMAAGEAPLPAAAASPTAAQAPPALNPAAEQPGPPPSAATAAQLQEMVAPIALYPDMLVAQILAASTYPTQVVEAARFVKDNPNLTGDALAARVNPQPWDPSVKSLCQFPSVLKTMSDSLSWTSALGEAYYNQPAAVMAAIQVMRKRAMDAGTLKSTSQQTVVVQNAPAQAEAAGPIFEGQETLKQPAIVIEPAQPNLVYVPYYNPAVVYGAVVPLPAGYYAEYYGYSGTDLLAAGVLGFGAGIVLGSLINGGYNSWGTNWWGGNVVYNQSPWFSRSSFVGGGYGYGYRGYGPGYGWNRAGYPGYPGYAGGRPGYAGYGRPGFPSTLAANRANFAANNPRTGRPNFPQPGTLPHVSGFRNGTNFAGSRRGGSLASNRLGTNLGANSLRGNFAGSRLGGAGHAVNNPARGYGVFGGNRAGRSGAFGGYRPGGSVRMASNRGRVSSGGGSFRMASNRGRVSSVGGGGGRAFAGGGGRAFAGGGHISGGGGGAHAGASRKK